MYQYSGLPESVLVAMICRAVRYFLSCDLDLSEGNIFVERLCRPCLPLLSIWKECRVFGIWSCNRIMHDPSYFVVTGQHCFLPVNRGNSIGFTWLFHCMLRLWLSQGAANQEAPCGDFVTHFFCHLCALCQEYREIRERSGSSYSPDLSLVEVTAPQVQTMEPASTA
ncbi:protein PLANT CADMIUM RESISTANCE 10 isoform X2 [Daucus carota subsp. sativus]|uniref:protein PLANT CADMIUM RESISTANCE 10 isoform X2 n=1 Tax=Daucus carota subsp. sativus TaxID=79200 RepID=UPI00308337B2